MEENHTVKLLKECDAGSKMAVVSIDEVIEKITDSGLKEILTKSKSTHEKLGNEIHEELLKQGAEEKDPNPIAKGMSWMKTNAKITMKESDQTVADLITDGCNMGIKSLYRYKNQYPKADEKAFQLCDDLIETEEVLRMDMRKYL
ncbi:MAG: hypothetical protein PHW47_13310 [Lachnospira sp.]|nr:hypothetical protein [Lachnospira sp.]